MRHKYIIKRISKCDYQDLDFPDELQQSLLQLKEDLASNLGLVFADSNYISEKRNYHSFSFQSQQISIEIIASVHTRYYEVVVDHNLPSWHTYLTEALETYFNLYSQTELLENAKNETQDRKNAIGQLIDGTITGEKVEPEVLNLLKEVLKDKDTDLLQEVLWSLLETPYLLELKSFLEEMRANNPDEGVKITLDYLLDEYLLNYEFSDDLPNEEVIETSLSFNEQSIDEVPQQVLESRHIKKLSLSENNLKFLPEELGNLTELRSLSVYSNSLRALPKSLVQLQNLEEIFAYHNQIQEFPQLPESIRIIYLSSNQIQIIPAAIENLTALEWLDLDNNKIREVHPNISKLWALEYLDLSNNPLYTIPEGITRLPKLKTLLLHSCPLEDFPNSFPGLQELQTLLMTDTNLSSIKPSIKELTSLERLSLNISQLTDIPENITFPENLRSIGLSQARLTSLPPSILQLNQLTKLFLPFNSIEKLPNEIGQCGKLESLWLSNNKLQSLPDSFWQLTNLKEVRLERNFFSEDVKESIRQWAKERQISLTI